MKASVQVIQSEMIQGPKEILSRFCKNKMTQHLREHDGEFDQYQVCNKSFVLHK